MLGSSCGFNIGRIKLQHALAVERCANAELTPHESEDFSIFETKDLGALGLLIGEDETGGDAFRTRREPDGDADLIH